MRWEFLRYVSAAVAAVCLSMTPGALGDSLVESPQTTPTEQPADDAPAAGQQSRPNGDASTAEPARLQFNFKGATFQQVIEYFSRVTGLPVVWEADAPQGTLEYTSKRTYDLEEALRVLNIILQSRGVMLRVDDDMLYLQKLSEMQRENVPTFVGELPDDVTADQIITVVRPLNIALAKGLAEKLKPMVAEYGSVTAVEQQNALVITETAAQVRRLVKIIDELDRQDIEGQVEIYAIRHTRASNLLEALKSLLSEKVEKYVINQQGQQVKIEEESLPGLSLSADDRTNSIIAKGSQNRIDKLAEAIELLDVPATPQMRAMRTFNLQVLSPSEAARHVNQLFQKREEGSRPTVLPMDDFGKLTVIGDDSDVGEAEALLQELDGASTAGEGSAAQVITVVHVEHITPAAGIEAVRGLLNHHQRSTIRLVGGPDGTSIIMAGRSSDVEAAQTLMPLIDQPAETDRQVRMMRIDATEPAAVVERARALFEQQVDTAKASWRVSTELNPRSRVLTLIGPRPALDRFVQSLQMVEQNTVVQRETRQVQVHDARPSALAASLKSLAQQVLNPGGEQPYVAPEIQPVDALDMLLITAVPEQFDTLESLVKTLDKPSAKDFAFRVMPVRAADAEQLLRKTRFVYEQLSRGYEDDEVPMPEAMFDAATGNMLVSGRAESVQLYEQAMGQAQRLLPPDRSGRLHTLREAKAADVVDTLRELLARTLADESARDAPQPSIEVIERTNSLYVVAEASQHGMVERLIRELDHPVSQDLPPLRVLPVRHSDASQVAEVLRRRYDGRSVEEKIDQPVHVDADREMNTLIVTADDAIFDDIASFVDSVSQAAGQADRLETMIFPLEHADAGEVSSTLDRLYPQPLPPRDWRGRPQWNLQEPRDVQFAADAATNTLFVHAVPDRREEFTALVAQLDRPAPGSGATDVRVFTLTQAEANDVAEAVRATAESRAPGDPAWAHVTVTAAPSANAVVVAAGAEQLDALQPVVESLDSSITSDRAQVRAVFLRHARAERVAPIVQELLAGEEGVSPDRLPIWARFQYMQIRQNQQREAEFRVSADARLNAVVVAGPVATLDVAEQLIGQLDVDPSAVSAAPQRTVRVLTVENADARQLASNIEAMFTDERSDAEPPIVRVDAASNSLIVRATEDQYLAIEQLVGKIDQATIASSRQMRMIPIDAARAEADDVARVLKRLLDRSGSTSVEVITVEDLLKRQEKRSSSEDEADDPSKVSQLDRSSLPAPLCSLALAALGALPPEGAPTSTVAAPMTNQSTDVETEEADGDDAAGAVAQQVLSELEESSDITIAVDEATNSIVVIGSSRAVEHLAALAEQIQREMPAQPDRIRYVALPTEVDARDVNRLVAQTLSTMTPPGGRRGDLRRRTTVIPDVAANALIVAASDDDFETIADLITVLSRPPSAEPMVIKIYALSTITAERAADNIDRMLSPDRRGRRNPERALDLTLMKGEQQIEAEFDPRSVLVSADSMTNTVIVTAPPDAIGFLDRFIELIDEAPPSVQSTLKLYPLKHARADELVRTLRSIFRSRFNAMRRQGRDDLLQPDFAADERTNMLLVTAAPELLSEVDDLLDRLDRKLGEDMHPLRMIELTSAQPSRAAELIQKIVLDTDQKRRESTMLAPDDQSGMLLVRASDEVMDEIDALLTEIDRDATEAFEVRTITLKLASATAVARALQQLYDDRAKIASTGRGRRNQSRQVSIIGDEASRTLLVAASDEDFEQIRTLVEQFDSPQAANVLDFHVYPLEHARATEIQETVQGLVQDLTYNQGPVVFWGWGGNFGSNQQQRGTLAIRADNRLNALIVTGEGDKFQLVERLIEVLDAPPAEGEQRIVRLYRIEHADVNLVADVLLEVFSDPAAARRWWEPLDPTEPRIRVDESSNTIIVSGSERVQEEMREFIDVIDEQTAAPDQSLQVLTLEYVRASELARTLSRFLRDRAEATNAPQPSATIVPSDAGNALVVSASDDDLAMIRDLLTELDQPDVSGDRSIEIVALRDGEAQEIARILREQFGSRDRQGLRVTPDARTNSLILNVPKQQLAQVQSLIDRLDAPAASDETIIRTYQLDGASAEEAKRMLAETLQLDSQGRTTGITIKLDDTEGEAVEVQARIVADRRSNSLIITATEKSFPVLEALIERIDNVPSVSPVEYRIIPLEHAVAVDVAYTLRQFTRNMGGDDPEPRIDYNRIENQLIVAATVGQFEQIKRIVEEIDVPSERQRVTDFVPLKYAEAEQVQEALSVFYGPFAIEADTPGRINARIVADPATNSLVISADEGEWENIRALLEKLDSEEYDSSLQLRVMPLIYADARSVARAINEAFQTTVDRPQQNRPGRSQPRGNGDDRRDLQAPTVLVSAEEWVRASAEPQTNSVIVSASRQNVDKVEQIIEQLDVADYAKLPPPQIIPVTTGNPEQLAASLNQLYEQQERSTGSKSLRIVGNAPSNTIIVRAEQEEFEQVKALAEALQQQASTQGLTVHVLRLTSAPATRVAAAIREAYRNKAQQASQPLSINVDAAGNALVIACTGGMFDEIEQTVEQLDALAPSPNQSIFIIELEHVSPDAAVEVIRTIGLDQPQPEDSVSRLVTDPIKVSTLRDRRAIVIVANPVDRETVIGLLKSIDAEPELAEATMRVVTLRNAEAEALTQVLGEILRPGAQQSQTALAEAVQEQVRRLAVQRDGADEQELNLDLSKPIRIIPDVSLNALVLSSTPENVEALTELISMFDTLPITDAVTVQIFPLENIAAEQFSRIVRELFQQGKQLRGVPGTALEGMPGGALGRALLDNVALSVDERTNTVVVAGKEDAVAFVEVLSKRLDTDISVGWIEPRIVPLRYADSTDLAELLQSIIVEGQRNLPQSTPLQQQVGRLRLARQDDNGGAVLESEIFQPMSRLVIRAEPQLNALILVGTPVNLEVVGELIDMLDVEAASPSAVVRIYPVEHASAARIAVTIENLFEQQVRTRAIRPEDRVIIEPDERTNSLVVTTSPRSFAVLEHLLELLDAEVAPDLREIRRLELEFASASRLAQLVQEMMDARLERLRKVQPETADLERATITAEPRTNSLIIAAGNESFDVIRKLVKELDVSTLAEDSLVETFAIEKGNLDRIAEAVDAIMERRYADLPAELRNSQRPLVLTEPRTNSLLVAANPEDITAIGRLIDKLEATPLNPAVGLHVIPLETTQADMIAPRLQRLMRDRQQSLGQASTPSDRVSIEPDTASNSLIVAANDENLQIVMRLIDALSTAEQEGVGEGEFEVIALAKTRASQVVDMLDELYVVEENDRRGDGTIRVTADERINAVLVRAPKRDVAEIRRLVAQLDGATPSTVVEIKYIPLTSANALETVGLIETVLSGRGIGTRGTAQATVLKYLRELAEQQEGEDGAPMSEMEVSTAIRESISLTPDVRTNTIIVRAPRESMDMIEQMIRDLDESSVGAKNIRVFKLTNADATAMAEILVDLFNLRQGRELLVLKPREDGVGPVGPGVDEAPSPMGPLFGTELTAVPDERQQLSITVDSRTNSLLVSGSPTYLDLVADVVTELDNIEANERETFVYALRNSEATEVARVIGNFVEEEQRKLIETLSTDQLGSAARVLEREVTIVGDEKSNTVLVSASPRYMQRVQEMIKELDVDPPQVLIQVLLAEVTLDYSDEWGVDMNASGDVGEFDVAGGFGLASAFVTGMGVPSLTVSSSDFDLLIRALQSQGRLQVLSNPSVMAANNESAQIQVGETIRVPESTSFTDTQQRSEVVAEDIGIILNVTPSINPDGFVRMTIQPEISELSARTIQISEDFQSPIITRRQADTTVTVMDGQTIVIGGLISDRYELRTRKVPLLGDIPLVGMLFRSDTETSTKTEFLIVLTPYVVASPAEIEDMTEREVERLSVPMNVKEQIRRSMLEGRLYDSEGNLISPDKHSTLVPNDNPLMDGDQEEDVAEDADKDSLAGSKHNDPD